MNTTETIRNTAAAPAAGDLFLDGIRELSHGNEQAALQSFACALGGGGTVGALCTARLYILRREPDRAARTLTALLAREPGLAEAHYLLGTVHRGACRTFDAIRCFRAALRLEPRSARVAGALAELLDVQEP